LRNAHEELKFFLRIITIGLFFLIVAFSVFLEFPLSSSTSNSATGCCKSVTLALAVLTGGIPEVCYLIGHSGVYGVNLALNTGPCGSSDCFLIDSE
jgi:hypothetical protein